MDTNVKTPQIRIQLSTLDDFMVTCGHDTSKFNRNVKVILDSLKARGETENNLLANIFKGYAACRDKVFSKCLTCKQKGYEKGINILPYILMHLAVQKFKLLKTTNKWNVPSGSEEKIIAL